jgi:hypothetical protein
MAAADVLGYTRLISRLKVWLFSFDGDYTKINEDYAT